MREEKRNNLILSIGKNIKEFFSVLVEPESFEEDIESYKYSKDKEIAKIADELYESQNSITPYNLDAPVVKRRTRTSSGIRTNRKETGNSMSINNTKLNNLGKDISESKITKMPTKSDIDNRYR